jgi:hypothetical protein
VVTTPARLLVEALLVPGHTVPTKIVQTVIVADRFNHVRGLSIATFAAMSLVVFSGNHYSMA